VPPLEIIGVAGDATFQSLREKTLKLYTPWRGHGPAATYQIRTAGDARFIAPTLREAIHRLDPKAFIADLRTMDEAASAQYAQERSVARLTGVFSSVALALAAVGIYGVLAYNVTRRTREIGIRMALGAQYSGVVALVVRQGMELVFVGCVLGIGSALSLVRFVQNRLFGVTATDPYNLIMTVCLLITVTLLACWLPARRAAKVDPMVALRAE
jgi:ABC-type antimicrobial peptide transport system permease subunit